MVLPGRTIRSARDPLKNVIAVLMIVASVVRVLGESPATKRIILSPKSNLDTATVSEGLAQNCPNVVVTENESKADYVLEASSTTKAVDGTSHSEWHFTLLNKEGDVLVTTHPEKHFTHRFKHHFESVCNYINAK
jgi:hypothetical protein